MTREFHRPATIAAALTLKRYLGAAATFLAGGTLVNSSRFSGRTGPLISLDGLDLGRLEARPGQIALGAGVTLQALVEAPVVPAALRQAALLVGNRNIRNQATIGGQIGAMEPHGALLPALLTLEASVVEALPDDGTAAPGAADLAREMTGGDGQGRSSRVRSLEAVLESGLEGLLCWVHVPVPSGGRGSGLARYARTAGDLSLLHAAVSLGRDGDRLDRPIVAVGGIGPRAVRLATVEQALAGAVLPAPGEIATAVEGAVDPRSDVRGSARFKRYMAGVLVADALARAWKDTFEEAGR